MFNFDVLHSSEGRVLATIDNLTIIKVVRDDVLMIVVFDDTNFVVQDVYYEEI